MRKSFFLNSFNASLFYFDLRKSLLLKPQYCNSYSLPNFNYLTIDFRLSNIDNSRLFLLLRSLNLFYDLTKIFPQIRCGNFRWLSKGKVLGIILSIFQLNFSDSFLLLRSISLINQLRFAMLLRNIKLFRDFSNFFILSVPFFDITKSALIVADWYFDWQSCIFFTLHSPFLSFRELRYSLKLFDFLQDSDLRKQVLFKNFSITKKFRYKQLSVALLNFYRSKVSSQNKFFISYISFFF